MAIAGIIDLQNLSNMTSQKPSIWIWIMGILIAFSNVERPIVFVSTRIFGFKMFPAGEGNFRF